MTTKKKKTVGKEPQSAKPPWKKPAPKPKKKKTATKLTPEEQARAKARAKRAGRRYPNLVDNMRVAAEKKVARRKTKA